MQSLAVGLYVSYIIIIIFLQCTEIDDESDDGCPKDYSNMPSISSAEHLKDGVCSVGLTTGKMGHRYS